MTDLHLTRVRGDRDAYVLEGVGTLRREGFLGRHAIAEAGGAWWRFSRQSLWHTGAEAVDACGVVVGEFAPRLLRRGGELYWAGCSLVVRPASSWRARYALVEDDHELAVLDARAWGRQPVTVTVAEPHALEPGLLLFVVFVVRSLGGSSGDGAAGATVATYGGYGG